MSNEATVKSGLLALVMVTIVTVVFSTSIMYMLMSGPLKPSFTGQQGIQGIQGLKGDQGIQGIQGIIGFQGPQGNAGATGATGPTGLAGKDFSVTGKLVSLGIWINTETTYVFQSNGKDVYQISWKAGLDGTSESDWIMSLIYDDVVTLNQINADTEQANIICNFAGTTYDGNTSMLILPSGWYTLYVNVNGDSYIELSKFSTIVGGI